MTIKKAESLLTQLKHHDFITSGKFKKRSCVVMDSHGNIIGDIVVSRDDEAVGIIPHRREANAEALLRLETFFRDREVRTVMSY